MNNLLEEGSNRQTNWIVSEIRLKQKRREMREKSPSPVFTPSLEFSVCVLNLKLFGVLFGEGARQGLEHRGAVGNNAGAKASVNSSLVSHRCLEQGLIHE